MCIKIKHKPQDEEQMTAKDYATVVVVIAVNYAIVLLTKLI